MKRMIAAALLSCLLAVPARAEYSIEVDVVSQTIGLYEDGDCIMMSECVTGTQDKHDTPIGEYFITYKSRGETLSGADYNVTVSYWMAFNGGIGIHDADWRSDFGGDIYTYAGSHGCVNVPEWMAYELYTACEVGTAVVVR